MKVFNLKKKLISAFASVAVLATMVFPMPTVNAAPADSATIIMSDSTSGAQLSDGSGCFLRITNLDL